MESAWPKKFKELQAVWLDRLQAASDEYRQASAAYRNAAQDYQSQFMPSADGDFSLRQALKQQNLARAEYARTLRIFTDLLLNGVIPKEPAPGENDCVS
jgi:hypothetical protein